MRGVAHVEEPGALGKTGRELHHGCPLPLVVTAWREPDLATVKQDDGNARVFTGRGVEGLQRAVLLLEGCSCSFPAWRAKSLYGRQRGFGDRVVSRGAVGG